MNKPMPLSPGTALQNGQYVIDALLEAAPNGDLYWGTHIVTGMQVYIQTIPLSTSADDAEVSALIAHLQGVSFSAQSPLPRPFQLFRDEAKALYLAMGVNVGRPWTLAHSNHVPMPLEQAIKLTQTIAHSVEWLGKRGLAGIDLSFNRIWVKTEDKEVTLTGLPQKHIPDAQNVQPLDAAATVRSLARLLYSFLLGELPQAKDDSVLGAILQQRLPTLNPAVALAIHKGATAPGSFTHGTAIAAWLAMLPDPTPCLTTTDTARSAGHPPSRLRLHRWGLYPTLGLTALLAAIGGATAGTAWRLNAGSLPGDIQLDPNQSFPPQAGWSGDTPDAAFETPYIPGRETPGIRDNWTDSDWETVEPDAEWTPEISEEPEETIPQEVETFEEETPLVPSPWASMESIKEPATDKILPGRSSTPDTAAEMLMPPLTSNEDSFPSDDSDEEDPALVPKAKSLPAPAPAPTSES